MRVLRIAALTATALTAGLAGCGQGNQPGQPPDQSAARSSPAAVASPAASESIAALIDVGQHRLYLRCEGAEAAGSPTIVYLHGLGGDGGDFDEALGPLLEGRGRRCTYDRLNVGRSDSEAGRHSGLDSVRDMDMLLDAAGVPPPYVLVGFSFGGLIGTMFAGAHPDKVAGLLLLDSSLPTDGDVDALIPDGMREEVMREQEDNQERVDFYGSLEQGGELLESVPDIPVAYLAAEPVDLPTAWPVDQMRARIRANQEAFVARFTQGRLVPVESSHDIDLDHPALVVAELDRILAE